MKINFLGTHNAESKNTRLISLLIDDIIAIDAGSLTSELSFPSQEKIKAILLTHGHYDHIRDVPAFAFNNACHITEVFGTQEALEILDTHLVDGVIYPKFTDKTPVCETKTLKFIPLEPLKTLDIEGYQVLPIPVNHPAGAVGFEITSKDGKKIFFTGDTGQGLSDNWKHVSSKMLIMDVTFPNKLENTARNSSHLCPKMLKEELIEFQKIKGYSPQVVLVHLTPKYQKEIREEIKEIAEELNLSISIASEGEKLVV